MARILVVDDSIVMRKNLQTILKEGGHEVVGQALNGKQAVSSYFELNPDLVTMDITMPIMNGVEAVGQILSKDPNANIIVISALNQKQMVFEALNNGAKHYIIKPIDPGVLMSVINEVLTENGDAVKADTEIDVQAEEKNVASAEVEEPGFSIENINNAFIIYFNKDFGLKDLTPLETAIKGLLFIKPLNIVFSFDGIEDLPDQMVIPLRGIRKNIQSADGNIEYKANNEGLINKIKDGNKD